MKARHIISGILCLCMIASFGTMPFTAPVSAAETADGSELLDSKVYGSYLYREIDGGVEITAEGVDKERGLLELCRILGIDPARTVGVGDGANDEPLLRAAGLAVAMGNATPEIAEMADATVADNARDGAAEAIERFLL